MRAPASPGACLSAVRAAVRIAFLLAAGAGIARAADGTGLSPIGEAFPLMFDAEWIVLDIVGDSLEVRGRYVLLCRAPTEDSIPLFYPFPTDSLLGGARMVSLTIRGGAEDPVDGRWEVVPGAPGVRWWIPPCRGDSLVADAVYRQAIRTEYARYIVTTARVWGRPLSYAAFEIRLPPGAEPIEFSYPFEARESDGRTVYAWETEAFFPDRDIVVRWRR